MNLVSRSVGKKQPLPYFRIPFKPIVDKKIQIWSPWWPSNPGQIMYVIYYVILVIHILSIFKTHYWLDEIRPKWCCAIVTRPSRHAYGAGAHFTNTFTHTVQISLYSFAVIQFLVIRSLRKKQQIFHMSDSTSHLPIALPEFGRQWNQFPLNLNCGENIDSKIDVCIECPFVAKHNGSDDVTGNTSTSTYM